MQPAFNIWCKKIKYSTLVTSSESAAEARIRPCHSLRRRVERLRCSVYPPQNGAIVRTDSVRTKAYLQNSETCMRNLHW